MVEVSVEEGIQARARALVDEWERLEGESMREGHRATLERLIAAELGALAEGERAAETETHVCESPTCKWRPPVPAPPSDPDKQTRKTLKWQQTPHAFRDAGGYCRGECGDCGGAADAPIHAAPPSRPAPQPEPPPWPPLTRGSWVSHGVPGPTPERVEPVRCPSCGEILGAWKHFNCAPVPSEE